MSHKLINLTLPVGIVKVENVLENYLEYPYQIAFSLPELRRIIPAHVLTHTPNTSIVFKTIGTIVICFNLVMLPLALPVSAQTDNVSGEATTGTTPPQENTSSGDDYSSWGLLGLLGLAGLFRKPAKSSAVGLTSNEQLQTSVHAASDRIQHGVAEAGVGVRSFLGELKTDVDDFKHSRAEAKEIKQIKSAVGRWSNRIILDKQDNIILNVGDLITHRAVEHARSADVLDVLLDSVDDRTKVANEEQSPASIEASLEGREQENAVNRNTSNDGKIN